MSNPYAQPQPNPYGAPSYGPPKPQENTLGLVGFIVSLLGFLVCIAAPVGLVLSLMGLRREPKGFAIAGTIIGGLITLGWLGIIAFYGAVIAACIGLGVSMQPQLETQSTLRDARRKIEDVRGADGVIPGAAEGNGLIQGMQDHWKRQVRYEPREGSYSIRSAGADGQFDTPDDVVVHDYDAEFGSPPFDVDEFDPSMPRSSEDSLFPEPESKPEIPLDDAPPAP